MKTSRKLLFSAIAAYSLFLSSEAFAECSIFTGVWKDLGKGVIAYLGDDKVILYNGNSHPSFGDCLSNNRIRVTFQPSGKILEGEIRQDSNLINWSGGSIWKRVSSSVNIPGDIPRE